MPRYPHNPPENEDDGAEAWVDLPQTLPDLRLVADTGSGHDLDESDEPLLPEEFWFNRIRKTPGTADAARVPRWGTGLADRLPRGAWAALAATVAVLAGVLLVPTEETGDTGAQVPSTAAPPSSSTTVSGPCTGLTGEVVTESAGDPATLAGVIASFEAAYYIHRDAARAMPLLAPESGITFEGLAAGIASVPPGTRHCVAITPIAPTTANVHIAEIRPDRTRTDYLQLINTRPAETGGALLISNVQKQG
ncbi:MULTISPECIES: hypothetical protein [Nocardia]|uniref:DUF8176 domain-containing protein n=1 Tax=Nocardia asteroides NBRC 15531 TaxID=1110697 RepID=U5EAF5_NOCAS|nr:MULTISPECIES: hypothetical protein [Nocardia]TLF63379.1 hypothetical protein FEK33_25425 [Nocardia asteroides NBRC 15531]UGT47192.1 hypothetical protein LT345_22090 [Nocardia asteroides]SFM76865.1 hypothetical protein SAMN05444423_104158 [Nocardia asteroides]VEG33926.1 Uncharacterised protein [Nocardia asteroides]GAD87082.1 hypothetical protein NCAST_34_02120 [Nocardia asteroides NBRC 15531]